MDSLEDVVYNILVNDVDIENIVMSNLCASFDLYGNRYEMSFSESEFDYPDIVALSEPDKVFPHYSKKTYNHANSVCRDLCLVEDGTIVNASLSFNEKICDVIDRLKKLLNLSEYEKTNEFQNEFIAYWDDYATGETIEVFLNGDDKYQLLNKYQSKFENRYISYGVFWNDKKDFTHIPNVEAYYIPIIDTRNIYPPYNNKEWSINTIIELISGKVISHISSETYNRIKNQKSSSNEVILVFGISIQKIIFNFAVKIYMNKDNKGMLLDRIRNAYTMQCLRVIREDYRYLQTCIGASYHNEKIALVGVGSLGSYLAEQLIRNGFKSISIYDDDIFEPGNLMRHHGKLSYKGVKKTFALKYDLESIHPEIRVQNEPALDEKNIDNVINNTDIIIFTIGSTDEQLKFNDLIYKKKYKGLVFYIWLEAGGNNSHILISSTNKKGCFRCLHSGDDGEYIPNKVNENNIDIEYSTIRNGCGATRVEYGTSVILRTISVFLDVLKKIDDHSECDNCVININNNKEIEIVKDFYCKECASCGNTI